MVDSVLAADQHYNRNDVEIVKCEPCLKDSFALIAITCGINCLPVVGVT